MLRALIFDVDGTLAETEKLHRKAFNDAFVHFDLGWYWPAPLYLKLLKTTGGKERMQAYSMQSGARLSDDKAREIHRWKTARYAKLVQNGDLKLREGIKELLDFAKTRGLKTSVATTTNLPNVEALCWSCFQQPALQVFDHVAAGDMVKNKKPAPDVYQLALSQLNLNPDECIAFEDSENGVNAAKGAGLRVILSQSRFTQEEDYAGADFVINSFKDAREILEKL